MERNLQLDKTTKTTSRKKTDQSASLKKKKPTSHNKTVDSNKNKADVIEYLNRQQKILQIIDIIEEEEIAKKHLQCINSTKNVSISNPEKFISYNTNKLLKNLPSWLYFSRPNNIAYHNLTASSETALLGIKSLLGLGLNFCITPDIYQKVKMLLSKDSTQTYQRNSSLQALNHCPQQNSLFVPTAGHLLIMRFQPNYV